MQNLPLLRIVGVLFGACFLAAGIAGARLGLEALKWPTAPGHIVISEPVGMGDDAAGKIVAEFPYGPGWARCGHVVAGRENMTSEVRNFPVGAPVNVSYNPRNLAQCVFRPGISGGSLVFALVGLGAFGMAGFAHWTQRRQAQA
jgi:hypothetical protein